MSASPDRNEEGVKESPTPPLPHPATETAEEAAVTTVNTLTDCDENGKYVDSVQQYYAPVRPINRPAVGRTAGHAEPSVKTGRTARTVWLHWRDKAVVTTTVACLHAGERKLQALVYDTLPSLEEGAGKRCSECGANAEQSGITMST